MANALVPDFDPNGWSQPSGDVSFDPMTGKLVGPGLMRIAAKDYVAGQNIAQGQGSVGDYARTAARAVGAVGNRLVSMADPRNLIKMAVSGATLPGDVASGKTQVMDPATGDVSDEAIQRSLDLTGLMSGGSLAKAPADAEVLGSGPVRSAPRTPEFDNWFKDSKVVDSEGKPLVVYHGTKSDITAFDPKKAGASDAGLVGRGFYFTYNPEEASGYALNEQYGRGDAPNVIPAHVSLQNPLIIKQGILPDGRNITDLHKMGISSRVGSAIQDDAKAVGHDGVIFTDRDGNVRHAVAFDPTQVKSVNNAGTFSSTDPNILSATSDKSTAAVIAGSHEPFYSAASRAVDALPMKQAPAEQWAATLKNQPGVRGEELANLEPWLQSKAGQPVTKDEIKAQIAQTTPQIKEVVHGAQSLDEGRINRAVDENMSVWEEDNPDASPVDVVRQRQSFYDDIVANPEEYELEGDIGGAKYSQYQLPGGENYREVLMTLPEQRSSGPRTFKEWADASGREDNADSRHAYRQWMSENQDIVDNSGNYQSSHWDEPNVLAHLRLNDRYLNPVSDADIRVIENKLADGLKITPGSIASGAPETGVARGVITPQEAKYISEYKGFQNKFNSGPAKANVGEKMLFAEEMQSDWHQEGRKQGYNQPLPTPEQIDQNASRIYGDKWDAADEPLRNIMRDDSRGNLGKPGVPDAPFKKSWPELLLKRLVSEAANKGYDQVAWTDGATQAARYDLSKQVEDIAVHKHDDGTFTVHALPRGASDTVEVGSHVQPDKLAGLVGKDLAEKIAQQKGPRQAYNGLDLKVGGEGMKGFYDDILPKAANKLFGKLGGKVEPGKLDPWAVQKDGDKWSIKALDGSGNQYTGYPDEQSARKAASTKFKIIGNDGKPTQPSGSKVHVLKITPQLRDHVQKNGLPLFSSGVPLSAPTAPSDDASQNVNRSFDVPAFAGSSKDGSTVYIDRRVPRSLNIDGKVIDPAKYLSVHERTENMLMTHGGMSYEDAHHAATQAERQALEADGVDWKSYEAHINGMLRTIEQEKVQKPPPDLYLKPYHAPGWGNEAEKLDPSHARHLDRRDPAVSSSGRIRLTPVDHDPFAGGNNG